MTPTPTLPDTFSVSIPLTDDDISMLATIALSSTYMETVLEETYLPMFGKDLQQKIYDAITAVISKETIDTLFNANEDVAMERFIYKYRDEQYITMRRLFLLYAQDEDSMNVPVEYDSATKTMVLSMEK